MMSGPLNIHVGGKMSLDLYLTPHTKINSRWIAYLQVERSKLSEENKGDYLHELGGGQDFIRKTQVLATKGKQWQTDNIKIKSLCASKDSIKLPTEWGREGLQSYSQQRTWIQNMWNYKKKVTRKLMRKINKKNIRQPSFQKNEQKT